MTNVHRAYIYILLTVLASLCVTTLYAQKKDKPKKPKHVETALTDIQPDPIASKSRPDRHPKPLEMPVFANQPSTRGKGTGGSGAHGIDVSHYQGRINWDEVARDSKVTYVYLKATEGTGNVDDTYSYNFNECKRVGLKVGSYHFFRPQLSAKSQFDNFMSRVETRRQDLLPVVDIETTNGVP